MDKEVYDTLDGIAEFAEKVFFVDQLTDDEKDIVLPSVVLRKAGSTSEVFLDEPPSVSSVSYNCIVYEKDPAMLEEHETTIKDALVEEFDLTDFRHVEDRRFGDDGGVFVRLLVFTVQGA